MSAVPMLLYSQLQIMRCTSGPEGAYLRENLALGFFFGQMFATICVMTSGFSSSAKVGTRTTFSCQRRVAHFLIILSGAYFVTGTQTRRAAFLTDLAANPVFLKLSGLPSVNTMTFDCAVLRPKASSAFAVIKANDVSVLPLGQVRPAIKLLTFFKSLVKWVIILIPQIFSRSTFFVFRAKHLYTPPHVLGPL